MSITDHQQAVPVYIDDLLTASDKRKPIVPGTIIERHFKQIKRSTVVTHHSDEKMQKDSFDVLLVDVEGLQLALPVHDIDDIITLSNRSLNNDQLIMGCYQHEHCVSKIINTARIVIPEKYRPSYSPPKQLILVAGYQWAMACHHLISIIHLPPDEIRWRKRDGKRPWLAATVINQRCSIVDIDKLINQLNT